MWIWSCFHCSVAGLEEQAEVKSMSSEWVKAFSGRGQHSQRLGGDDRKLHSPAVEMIFSLDVLPAARWCHAKDFPCCHGCGHLCEEAVFRTSTIDWDVKSGGQRWAGEHPAVLLAVLLGMRG